MTSAPTEEWSIDDADRSRLAAFASAHGELVHSAANAPVRLDGTDSAYYVVDGALDVFCREHDQGRVAAAAKHVLRAEPGRLVFGIPQLDNALTVEAKGLSGTRLLRLNSAVLGELVGDASCAPKDVSIGGFEPEGAPAQMLSAEVAQQADLWVSDIARAVVAGIESRPQVSSVIGVDVGTAGSKAESETEPKSETKTESGTGPEPETKPETGAVAVSLEPGSVVTARQSQVVWVSVVSSESDVALGYLSTEIVPAGYDRSHWVPLTSQSWATVTVRGPSASRAESTTELRVRATSQLGHGELAFALEEFHRLAFNAEALNRRLRLADEVNAQTALTAHRQLARSRASSLLDSLAGPADDDARQHESALMVALERIGHHSGIEFREPRLALTVGPATLEQIVEASGVRSRQVRLARENRWWRGDSGAMLAYQIDNDEPVALLPSLRGYRAISAQGRVSRLNAANAADYRLTAWTFYPKLADDRPATPRDLLRLSFHGAGGEVGRFLLAGLIAALITQAPAIALGMLTDWALPFARANALAQILVALALLSITAAWLTIFGGMTLLRTEARAGARLSAAAWDRMLALPMPFFRDTIAGELAVRMATFQRLRDLVSGLVANVLASVVFLLPTLGVLMFYDPALAAVALASSVVALVVIVGLGLSQIPHQRFWHESVRTLSGRLLQFVGGISKIRAAGAQTAAFASWAGAYRDKQLAEIRSSRIDEHLAAFGAAFPFGFAALLCAVTISRGASVGVGDFAVVLSASFVLYAAVADFGRAVEMLAEARTAYEQITPVLKAVPERDAAATVSPTVLDGEIVVDQVSFRYQPDGPLILEEVTIAARLGEFVAIVGGSGSGKSTLARLMLGLETPERGAVYFDGRDLRNLDSRSVRRQIGVVPQNSTLQPGSLVENIIGMADDLSLDDAWVAARLAAVDADIAEMPMQMMTMVTDRAGIFSGGQIQRIRIAAALVRKPRIVILDEATSWLDARSQAEVMSSIEGLGVTRIVIAHRLSTIRHADRIYVLDAGRVAQVGRYDELLEAPGQFRELVSRQLP